MVQSEGQGPTADIAVEHVGRGDSTGDSYGRPHLFRVARDGEHLFSVALKVTNSVAAQVGPEVPSEVDFGEQLDRALFGQGADLVGREFVEDVDRFERCADEGGTHDLKISTYEHQDWLAEALDG